MRASVAYSTPTAFMAFVFLIFGCNEQERAAPVEPAKAREALVQALECWKRGEPIETLKSASPPIVAQDFDWMAGKKLAAYEVAGKGKDDDANLRIPVKLTLLTPQGQQSTKSVNYVVGTSPALTVFRDF
ncbi:hypothetical protein EP7_000879 [Isosphaeraceae bacterium EP7]